MHHAIGLAAIIALFAFAFGQRAAQIAVVAGFLLVVACFAYVMFRIVTGVI